MATHDGLIAKLREKARGRQAHKVAEEIGISHAQLSRILSHQRQPGWKTLSGIVQAYPELHPWVSLFLSRKVPLGNDGDPIRNGE